MMAPAWPIRLPGGAVCPATNPITGFFTLAFTYPGLDTPSLDSDCRRCTPGNTSGSSSPLASWECERLPGTPRISHTLAARIQFESRASDRTRSLPLLHRLLEPIDKPLDFRFRQTHLSVFHLD